MNSNEKGSLVTLVRNFLALILYVCFFPDLVPNKQNYENPKFRDPCMCHVLCQKLPM
jgi:hypothetical protein